MRIAKLVNRALIWALLLLCTPVIAKATIGPRAQVPETTFDFGEVFEDVKLTHTFEIKDIGSAVLKITDIHSDCACTAVDSDRRIPPGGTWAHHADYRPLLGAPTIHQENQGVFQRPGPPHGDPDPARVRQAFHRNPTQPY
jgi:hypothetical protein